jgi:hypothetical protein
MRRVRVELYAWQRAYTLDEARRLVRDVAAGVAATPRLQAHFDEIPGFDRRMAERHDRAVAGAASALAACDVPRLTPGAVAWGGTCAAHVSPDRRELRVARALGSAPLAAGAWSTRGPRAPELPARLAARLAAARRSGARAARGSAAPRGSGARSGRRSGGRGARA